MLHTTLLKSYKFNTTNSMSLISTIFIVFIMSLITQFLLNISHHNIAEINIVLQGQRALFAAKSGVHWGITSAIINQNCPDPKTIYINQSGLIGFSVNITCISNGANSFKVTATANYGTLGENNYVTRTIIGKYQSTQQS